MPTLPPKKLLQAFTILEFLLALFLATLLVLTVYQVYGHVLDTYRRQKEDPSLRYLQISESLARQLLNLVCDPIQNERPLFVFEDDYFGFLTDFAPGGRLLVLYGPYPHKEKATAYLEIPYTGQKLPRHLKELLDEYKERLIALPPLKFKFYKIKEPGEENEGEEVENISNVQGLLRLQLTGVHGFSRNIYFSSCLKEDNTWR